MRPRGERLSEDGPINRTLLFQPLPLWKGLLWSLVGVGGFALSQWAIIVMLAKAGSAEMLGTYAYALAVTAPVLLLTQLNLRVIQAVDGQREFRFADYLGVRVAGSAIALVFLGLFVIFRGSATVVGVVIGILAFSKAADGLSDVVHGMLQQRERTDKQACSLFLRGLLQCTLLAVALVLSRDIMLATAAVLLGSLFSLITYDVPISRRIDEFEGEPPIHWLRLSFFGRGGSIARATLVRRAIPLGIMAVLASLYQNIPRYYIERELGFEAVGYYSAIFYLTFVGYTVVAAVGNATSPQLAVLFRTDLRRFRLVAFALSAAGAMLGGVGMVLAAWKGDLLLRVIYQPQYARFQSLLVWVMLSSCLWYAATLLTFASIAAGRLRPQAYLHALAALATLVSAPVLIGRYGLDGAAIALSVGIVPLLVGEGWIVWRATLDSPAADDSSDVLAVSTVP